MIGPTCPACDYIHSPVMAVGKFTPRGPIGYRALFPDAPIRSTRVEAEADECARRVAKQVHS